MAKWNHMTSVMKKPPRRMADSMTFAGLATMCHITSYQKRAVILPERNHNTQLVSPKHCEFLPVIGGSTSKKPNLCCYIRGQHRVLSVSLMTMVLLAGQGNPSNGSILYISQERAVAITGENNEDKDT